MTAEAPPYTGRAIPAPSRATVALQPQRQQPAAPPLPAAALATVLVGVLLPLVDFFIVNVALPTMAGDLHASVAVLELVVSGYAAAYAVLLVVGGRLGDAHGRRRLFLTGIAAFTVASLLCGLAPTAGMLVAARVLQGAAAALMVPQTLATIQATGNATSRAKALGWFGATGGLAAVAGQVLGGILVSADIAGTGWRPIFLVNVPIGLAGLWFAARHVPETRAPVAARPDLAGTTLLAVSVLSVLVPLTEGRALGWPTWSLALLASAPVAAAGFVAVERSVERRGHAPLVPSSVVRHQSMRRGLLLSAPFFAGFGAFMFVYALVAQGALGYSPLRAGITLAPMAVAFLVASLQTPRLVARYGRRVVAAGAVAQLAGLVALGATLAVTWPQVEPAQLAAGLVVTGYGQGLLMPTLLRVVLSGVPVEVAGAGSGVFTTMQQVSLAVGVGTLGTLFVTLAPAARLGTLHATLLVLGVQALVAVVIAAGSRGFARASG